MLCSIPLSPCISLLWTKSFGLILWIIHDSKHTFLTVFLDLTTVEGIVQSVISDLQQTQPLRREVDTNVAKKIDSFIEQMVGLLSLASHWTLVFFLLILFWRSFFRNFGTHLEIALFKIQNLFMLIPAVSQLIIVVLWKKIDYSVWSMTTHTNKGITK